MDKKRKNKTFAERLYKINVLPDGMLKTVEDIDVILEKIENPPFEDDNNS